MCVCVCGLLRQFFTDLLGNRSTPLFITVPHLIQQIETSKSVTMQDLTADYLRFRNPSSYLDYQKRKARTSQNYPYITVFLCGSETRCLFKLLNPMGNNVVVCKHIKGNKVIEVFEKKMLMA